MKKLSLSIIIIFGLFIFNGCKKDSIETKNAENITPGIKPDLTTPVSAGVAGFITDENGAAIPGALVKAGTVTSTTDAYGHFRIVNTNFAKSAGFVQVTKQGYFTGFRTFLPSAGKETFVHLQLITKTITGSINSSSGGAVNTNDGASIILPADAVVIAGGSTAYTGIVNVSAHWLDPSNTNVTLQNMPGDLRGINESGYLQSLTTYGMLVVDLSGSAGESLQIASGKNASLKIPIPSQLQAEAPASIPLWFFDETNGLWKQDGTGIKTGSNYEAQVSHFTYWNWDFPSPSVNVTAQILSSTSEPLANVPVGISIAGNNNYGYRICYTDTSGSLNCQLPGNLDYQLNVLDMCNDPVYTQDFSTASSDLNLGSISINPVQNRASITGTVLNCNNTAVENGFVFISDPNGITQSAYVHNGTFNLSLFYCSNPMTYVAFDIDNDQQSVPQTVNLISGTNDLGTIPACGAGSIEYLTLVVDGVPQATSIPEWGNGYAELTYPTQTHILRQSLGGYFVAELFFNGLPEPGLHTELSGIVWSTTNPYTMSFPQVTNLTITEYGPAITGFISGNFHLNCWDYGIAPNGPLHDVECHFRFQRTY